MGEAGRVRLCAFMCAFGGPLAEVSGISVCSNTPRVPWYLLGQWKPKGRACQASACSLPCGPWTGHLTACALVLWNPQSTGRQGCVCQSDVEMQPDETTWPTSGTPEPQGRVFLLLCQGPSLGQHRVTLGPLGGSRAGGLTGALKPRGRPQRCLHGSHPAVEVTGTGDGAEVMGILAGKPGMVAEWGGHSHFGERHGLMVEEGWAEADGGGGHGGAGGGCLQRAVPAAGWRVPRGWRPGIGEQGGQARRTLGHT